MSGHNGIVNAMSVDVEDYYQVSAFAGSVDRAKWNSFPSRVEDITRRTLDMFAEAGVRATFFTLGCVAERHKGLVRAIADAGHEVASHGWEHYRVGDQTPAEFRADVTRTKKVLEDLSGQEVKGYRAASFSIDRKTWWAFDELAEAGYRYSSSIHPIRHDHYGVPDAPRFPFAPVEGNPLTEIPVGTLDLRGRRMSCAGGGFFRLLPYRWSSFAIGQGQPGGTAAGDVLFPPVGDRPRPAAHQPRSAALTASALHQPWRDGSEAEAAAAGVPLGPGGCGLWAWVAGSRPAKAEAAE